MRFKTVLWVAVIAWLGLGVACSSSGTGDGPTNDGNDDKPWVKPNINGKIGLLIEPEPAADIGYRIGWESPIDLGQNQKITSVAALGDLIIVVEAPDNIVTALRADTGKLAWKISLGSDLEDLFKPSRDGKQIFIHSGTRFWTLAAKDGKVTAVAKLETSVSSAAAYSPDTRMAILTGTNGLVFGHSVDNNFSRWTYRLANRTNNSAVLAGQDVFVVDIGGTYAMLETANGSPLWRNRTLRGINSKPQVQGSEVIIASEDGKLYALNRTTGKDTWKYLGAEQPLKASPYALGRLIVQPLTPNKGLIAVDSINGKELWRADITAVPVLTRRQDMLLHTDNTLISIDLSDGELIKQVTTEPLMTVVPLGTDGAVVLVSAKGRLLRLSPL